MELVSVSLYWYHHFLNDAQPNVLSVKVNICVLYCRNVDEVPERICGLQKRAIPMFYSGDRPGSHFRSQILETPSLTSAELKQQRYWCLREFYLPLLREEELNLNLSSSKRR